MYRKTCRHYDKDYGNKPFVVNIDLATKENDDFRFALWTGEYLQATLMSIPVGGEIGLELHKDTDQIIRIEQGIALVQFGESKSTVRNIQRANENYAIFIPSGTWHNIINIGNMPLKLYSIYAPPHHPFGTIEKS